MNSDLSYVLITPARNEVDHIERTIQSVISQTVKPKKWVIVSDGSTDGTDEIVKKYLDDYPWIELIQMPKHRDRHFAAKVVCINAGYARFNGMNYDIIGNLDADISFGTTYYEEVLDRFNSNLKLGIAGGSRFDVYDGRCEKIERSRNSVMGAIQLFRRKCFEDIDGYMPLKGGGIDAVAEIMARMHRWEVETFPDLTVYHYRRTGTADRGVVKAWFRDGSNDYLIGYHPAFELLRCIGKMTRGRSGISNGLALLAGYCWAFLGRRRRELPDYVVRYLRSEQLKRTLSIFRLSRRDWQKI